jgi:hypothetical protein
MFYAFVMKVGGDVDEMNAYPTQDEVDMFGRETSGYAELDPRDPPDFWEQYDPPTVIVFEAKNHEAFETGKYDRPVAIYQRGEKYVCVKQD